MIFMPYFDKLRPICSASLEMSVCRRGRGVVGRGKHSRESRGGGKYSAYHSQLLLIRNIMGRCVYTAKKKE